MTDKDDATQTRRRLAELERQDQAVNLFLAGAGYPGVARAMNISRAEAKRIVKAALAVREAEHEELAKAGRTINNERLEMLLRAWAPKALNNDLQAARFVRDLIKDQRDLLGLDAARKVEHTLDAQVSTVALPVDEVLEDLLARAQEHAAEEAARLAIDAAPIVDAEHDEAPGQ